MRKKKEPTGGNTRNFLSFLDDSIVCNSADKEEEMSNGIPFQLRLELVNNNGGMVTVLSAEC